MELPQRVPGDSGRERHRRTLVVFRDGGGGDQGIAAFAHAGAAVRNRPAARLGGGIVLDGVGKPKTILVCLGPASGARRAASYADTGRAGPPTRRHGVTAAARRLGPRAITA